MTAHAFDRAFPGLGKWLVTFAAWLFAISTMITWAYYGEQGIIYIFRDRFVLPYKLVFLAATLFGAAGIDSISHMVTLIDLSTGAMLWANLPIVMGLGYLAVRSLNDYGRRLKAGKFHPHAAPPITDVVEGTDVE
jgi:AGCS family alanine or glycine:cation symporter